MQVHCLSDLCGMVPFIDPGRPDQGYRVIISQFIHSGLLDLAVSILMQVTLIGCLTSTTQINDFDFDLSTRTKISNICGYAMHF